VHYFDYGRQMALERAPKAVTFFCPIELLVGRFIQSEIIYHCTLISMVYAI
jgi:hypothetical protein